MDGRAVVVPMASERTNALLERVVLAGEHELEIFARWAVEVEFGSMDRNAARWWSRHNRRELLTTWGMSLEDLLEDWDEDEHGPRPEEGDTEGFDEEWLTIDGEDCRGVFLNPQLILPESGFFAEPLPAPGAEEQEEDRRRIPFSELLSLPDIARFKQVTEADLYPDPAPSTWQVKQGWKGNVGRCKITVDKATTLRELLTAQPLGAEVWVESGASGSADYHVSDVLIGEDDYVEWDYGNGKSTETELAPPDNMRLWRLAGTAIGRFMKLMRRASERVYAPGGVGEEHARLEFERLATAPATAEVS